MRMRESSNFSQLFKSIKFIYPVRKRLFSAFLLLTVSSAATVTVPYILTRMIDVAYTTNTKFPDYLKKRLEKVERYIEPITDRLLTYSNLKDEKLEINQVLNKLLIVSSFLLVIVLIGSAATCGRVFLIQTSAQRVIGHLRKRFFQSIILKQPYEYFGTKTIGELSSTLNSDTAVVGTSLTQHVADGARSFIQALACIGMMLYISPYLTVVSLMVVPPVAIFGIVYGRKMKETSQEVQRSWAKANAHAAERMSAIELVRTSSKELSELDQYQKLINQSLLLTRKESLTRSIFFSIAGASGNLVVLSVFFAGGILTTVSQFTVGDLSAFLFYSVYVGVAISSLSSCYSELMKGTGASLRLLKLFENENKIAPFQNFIQFPSDGDNRKLTKNEFLNDVFPNSDLVFRNVHFAYPSRKDIKVLDDTTMRLKSKEMSAIVGHSGCGKSTLFRLLLKLFPVQSGSINLSGINIENIPHEWLRQGIGYVPQEPIMLSGTIRENILYGIHHPSNVDDDYLEEIIHQTCMENFIEHLPDRLETRLGERGLQMSSGQRQRIAIARAAINSPKLFLLDEATSALDADSEYDIQKCLESITRKCTTIIIAHRLSTVRNADTIHVIERGGKLIEAGNFYDLLSIENGSFRRLVKKQSLN
ncbi:hypothetical protein SNEBB_008792 [Seison nebaliae]|nr:hypothetical protein SNEBB_008792 [Seison nebaliae]